MLVPSLGVFGGALVGQGVVEQLNKHSMLTREDTPNSARHHYDKLDDAMFERIRKIAPKVDEPHVGRKEHIPPEGATKNEGKYAQMVQATYPDGRRTYQVNINPNVDNSLYAHELGHITSRQTKPGRFVANIRDAMARNPKLGKALAYSLAIGVPGVGAAMQEGDDDLAESLALASAMASPVLIDEALATKNGLAIMEQAGQRATAGQRGRLATAYLSYALPALLAGTIGYGIGNVADDYTALYDL
jgi:hypothetical protein